MGQKIPVHDSTLKFNQTCLITINFFEYYIIIYSSPFWRLITYLGAYMDTVSKSAAFSDRHAPYPSTTATPTGTVWTLETVCTSIVVSTRLLFRTICSITMTNDVIIGNKKFSLFELTWKLSWMPEYIHIQPIYSGQDTPWETPFWYL